MALYLALFILVIFASRIYLTIDYTNGFHLRYLFKHLFTNALMLALIVLCRIFTKEINLFLFLINNLEILSHVYFYYHISSLLDGKNKKISNYNYIIFFILSAVFILNYFDIDLIQLSGNGKLPSLNGITFDYSKILTNDIFPIKQLYKIYYLVFIYFKIYKLKNEKTYIKNEKGFKIWINTYLLLSLLTTLQILCVFYNLFQLSDEMINIVNQISGGMYFILLLNYILNPALLISTFKIKVNHIDLDASNNYLRINDLVLNDKMYLNRNVSIGDVSGLLGLNDSAVRSAIKNSTNKNFNLYINTLRVNFSIELIKSDYLIKDTIETLSSECGFNSSQSFYRAFKNIKNTTPTEYYNNLKS